MMYLNRALYYVAEAGEAHCAWMMWTSEGPDPQGLFAPKPRVYPGSHTVLRKGEMSPVHMASPVVLFRQPLPPQYLVLKEMLMNQSTLFVPVAARLRNPTNLPEADALTAWFRASDAKFLGGSLVTWEKTAGTAPDWRLVGIPTLGTVNGQAGVHTFAKGYLLGGALEDYIGDGSWYEMLVMQDDQLRIIEYWSEGSIVTMRVNGVESQHEMDIGLNETLLLGESIAADYAQLVTYRTLISEASRDSLRVYMKNIYKGLVI